MDLMEAMMIYKKFNNVFPSCIHETKKYFLFPDETDMHSFYDFYFIAVDKRSKLCNRLHISEHVKDKRDHSVQWYAEKQIKNIWRTILENEFFETGKLSVMFRGASTYSLTAFKTYNVLSIEDGRYKIINDTGHGQFYPSKVFEIVDQ